MSDKKYSSQNKPQNSRRQSQKSLEIFSGYIEKKIEQLAESTFRSLFGSKKLNESTFEVPIQLKFSNRQGAFELTNSESISEQIKKMFIQLGSAAGSFQMGHVHCYLCESSSCSHSTPIQPSQVFAGYQSNGVPIWKDLHQILLDNNDEQATFFFDETHRLACLFVPGRELKKKLLPGFGKSSKTYDILGQVVFGYLQQISRKSNSIAMDDLAITIQCVECRSPLNEFRLELNHIAMMPPGVNPTSLLSMGKFERIYNSLSRAAEKIRHVESEITSNSGISSDKKNQVLRQIPRILNEFARSIEFYNRQGNRRTIHARERSGQNRPIQAATHDVKEATPANYFWDNHRKTLAIASKKGRVHIFTLKAKLVTSLRLTSEQIENRLIRKRWRMATPEERRNFLLNMDRLWEQISDHNTPPDP